MPLILLRVPDRGAIAAMFAVPPVPIEEHQMRRRAAVHRFVHPVQVLHRSGGAALGLALHSILNGVALAAQDAGLDVIGGLQSGTFRAARRGWGR